MEKKRRMFSDACTGQNVFEVVVHFCHLVELLLISTSHCIKQTSTKLTIRVVRVDYRLRLPGELSPTTAL